MYIFENKIVEVDPAFKADGVSEKYKSCLIKKKRENKGSEEGASFKEIFSRKMDKKREEEEPGLKLNLKNEIVARRKTVSELQIRNWNAESSSVQRFLNRQNIVVNHYVNVQEKKD